MLEILKYGTSQYGRCWVIGTIRAGDVEITDLYNTNITDESFFKDKTSIKIKKIKISRNKEKRIIFTLEF